MRILPLVPLLAAAVAGLTPMLPAQAQPAQQVLPGGTRYVDTRLGTGALAEPGRAVAVHYTGWLYVDGMKGRKFDSSRDSGRPFTFLLGYGQVIPGWDEGVAGMKVGGTRTLIVPPQAGYGENGAGDVIPPGATLLFEVELLGVQ
jgi:FKBP-type peptidyl-prolyl cis-trans isomerase